MRRFTMKKLGMTVLFTTIFLNLCSCSLLNDSKNVLGTDIEEGNSNIKVIDITLTDEPYGIGVNKEEPELLEDINNCLSKMYEDGSMDEIFSHYSYGSTMPSPVESAKYDETKDQLIVATTGDFAPFDYDIDGKSYGIDKEIVANIAQSLGKELVLVNTNFDIMFMSVYEHKSDICIAGITINDARKKYVDFTDPYYNAGLKIAVKNNNTLFDGAQNPEDIEKILTEKGNEITVGVEAQTTSQYYCQGSKEYGFDGISVNVNQYESLDDCIDRLKKDEIDAVIGDGAVLEYLCR